MHFAKRSCRQQRPQTRSDNLTSRKPTIGEIQPPVKKPAPKKDRPQGLSKLSHRVMTRFQALENEKKPPKATNSIEIEEGWRRRRDSNPRDPSGPTPLAGERLRPLGHVSVGGPIRGAALFTRQKPSRAQKSAPFRRIGRKNDGAGCNTDHNTASSQPHFGTEQSQFKLKTGYHPISRTPTHPATS